ncbi:MAG: tetratricopeptide repeat protein [Pirellulaceae bacterium]|nr:tetratricopeptide repeat protein [Pirellulaceae bacterium]
MLRSHLHWLWVVLLLASGSAAVLGMDDAAKAARLKERDELQAETDKLYNARKYPEAIVTASKMLAIEREVFGAESPAVADTLEWLMEMYELSGDYPSAKQAAEARLAVRKKLHPAESWQVTNGRLDLEDLARRAALSADDRAAAIEAYHLQSQARQLYGAGKYRDALEAATRSLATGTRVYGAAHRFNGNSQFWIGACHNSLGNYAEALQAMTLAEAIYRGAYGENHPSRAAALNTLAELQQNLGNYGEAEKRFRSLVELRKALNGDQSTDYATALSNLAFLYHYMGRDGEAEPVFLEVLKIYKATLGEQHAYYGDALGKLGGVYVAQRLFGKAEPLLQQSLEIRKKALGESHPLVAISLSNLGSLAMSVEDHERAIEYYTRAAEIRRAAFGEKSPRYADTLQRLMSAMAAQGNFAQAEPLGKQAVAALAASVGEKHPDYGVALAELARLHGDSGRTDEAQGEFARALAVLEGALGPKHSLTLTTLNNYAVFLDEREQYELSIPLHRRAVEKTDPAHPSFSKRLVNFAEALAGSADQQALAGKFAAARETRQEAIGLLERVQGNDHWQVADQRREQAYCDRLERAMPAEREQMRAADRLIADERQLAKSGKYREALPLAEQALAYYRRWLGDDDHRTAEALHIVGFLASETGDPVRAEELTRRALQVRRKVCGEDHPAVARDLHNLAAQLRDTGDADNEAVTLYRQALAIYENSPQSNLLGKANTLASLAPALDWAGDIAGAEAAYRAAMEIRGKVRGERSPEYAAGFLQLGALYRSVGDLQRAEAMLLRGFQIYRDALGDRHPDYARAADYLATCYSDANKYDEARPLYEQALAIRRRVLGDTHQETATTLNNLALLHKRSGEPARAIELYEAALAAWRAAGEAGSTSTSHVLRNLAYAHEAAGEPKKAAPLFREALASNMKHLGPAHPQTNSALYDLARHEARFGDRKEALELATEALRAARGEFERTAAALAQRQQFALRARLRDPLRLYLSLTAGSSPRDAEVYQEALAWKAPASLGQHAARQLRRSAPADGEPARLFAELDRLTRQLAARSRMIPDPAAPIPLAEELASLTERVENLQRQLAAASGEYRAALARERQSANRLLGALPAGTVLVDFVAYGALRSAGELEDFGPVQVEAFVLRSDRAEVVRVPLGPLAPITQALAAWRPALLRQTRVAADAQRAAQVRNLLWKPLEAHLAQAEAVLISPDLGLNSVPWGALPGGREGTYLIEDMAIAVVPVPQLLPDLLATPAGPPAEKSLLVVGGVDFDGDAGAGGDPRQSQVAVRGGDGLRFGGLPGTVEEAAAIRKSLLAATPTASIVDLHGERATEEAVREAVRGRRYLHFATHGYFAPAAVRAQLAAATRSESGLFASTDVAGYLPSLLSGLVLAGANRPPAPDADDGVLTAAEVEWLDLAGTELVTLSACETGLGEDEGGEGLVGLQRAFQLAGARATVATLWQVDDSATQGIMAEFYRGLWQGTGRTKLQALRAAQLAALRGGPEWLGKLRAARGLTAVSPPAGTEAIDDGRLPPYFWGAFVLSGDWR